MGSQFTFRQDSEYTDQDLKPGHSEC